jgi:hypothetical protein
MGWHFDSLSCHMILVLLAAQAADYETVTGEFSEPIEGLNSWPATQSAASGGPEDRRTQATDISINNLV